MQIHNPRSEFLGEYSFSKPEASSRFPQAEGSSFLNLKTKDPEAQKTFLNVLDKIAKKNERTEHRRSLQGNTIREPSKGSSKPLTDTQVEEVLDGFFNKLVQKQDLLEDSKVCSKVEKMFSNPLFNRILRRIDASTFENNSSVTSQNTTVPQIGSDPQLTMSIWEDSESISSRIEASTVRHEVNPNISQRSVEELREVYERIPTLSERVNEYKDDDDPGFHLYETTKADMALASQQLANEYDFPDRACVRDFQYAQVEESGDFFRIEESGLEEDIEETDEQEELELKYPPSNDAIYPIKFDKVRYNCLNIKYIFDEGRTGFEETKEFPIIINSIIAGRYQVLNYLGSAAFSDAIECLDLITQQRLCMKIIKHDKDYFDQSLDEIKLLQLINYNANVDEKHVLKFHDCFYFKEHLFIITELLRENLYEFSNLNRESSNKPYFTLETLKVISKQVLEALDYVHGLGIIHCDLKPENILMKDPGTAQVKVIDFGSSCFKNDHLSSYIQSRPYRAPEVILGCKYGPKIDIWSLGCVLAELWTGDVLFASETVAGLLARVIGIVGPFPEKMFREGRIAQNFFTQEKVLWQEIPEDEGKGMSSHQPQANGVQLLVPKKSSLKERLKTDDLFFLDFVQSLLQVDQDKRPTAQEAMMHPWLADA